jgi:hypothetical protein
MTKKEKTDFLQMLHDIRVPYGYSSNVSRYVKLKECTVGGLKSHDNHIIMQQLMPIALRGTLSDDVVRPLIKLWGSLGTFVQKQCGWKIWIIYRIRYS